jgi:recombination protein RecR
MGALVEAFRKLPGVGPRTAERYAFYLLSQPAALSREFSSAILKLKEAVGFCAVCFNLADGERCSICQDSTRDPSVVCVVEDHRSIRAMEKGGVYRGVYHVLLGALSPLDGIGPKDLRIPELKARIKAGGIREVVLATDSDLEGESTALYLAKELKTAAGDGNLQISRLAFGIPMGSSIEYADQVTLTRSMEGRRRL